MSLLESIILLLVVGSVLLGGGLYFALTKKPVKKMEIDKPVLNLPAADFELSTMLFPDRPVEYVPEPADRYDQTKFTAMVRDPFWLYTYWDIAATHQNELRECHGLDENGNYVIRVHDITEDINVIDHYDIPINVLAREWYIHVGAPNRKFVLELGAMVNGSFVLIAQSNMVKTPRDTVSDKIDPDWMLVDGLHSKLYGHIGPSGPSSAGLWQQPSSDELFRKEC